MIRFINVKFVKSASKQSQFIFDDQPQVALVGRSNVGKSSLINMLTNQSKLAKTSSTPGRTRLVNYFDVNGEFYLVDLPGYGFASASKEIRDQWNTTLDEYFENTSNLKLVLVLLDARRVPSELDVMMIDYLVDRDIPYTIVLTKTDKLSRSEYNNTKQQIIKTIRHSESVMIKTSAVKKVGIPEITALIDKRINDILD